MLLAVVKASLVVAFFMHLKYDHRYHLFVFLGTLLFLAIFFGFTLFDLTSRDELNDEQGTFVRWNDEAAEGKLPRIGVEIADPNACDKINASHGDAAGGHDAKAGADHEAKAGAGEAKAGH
jgi:cytochrome c oxidase subunit 4